MPTTSNPAGNPRPCAVTDGLNKPSHPFAAYAWSVLRDRSYADRRYVLMALQRRLEVGPTTENQELALRALEICQQARGDVAERVYTAWRSSQPRARNYPSATFIRNAFGTWNSALAVMRGEAVPDLLATRLQRSAGKLIPVERIKQAIRAWSTTVPEDRPLRLEEFVRWSCEQNEDTDSPYGRLPESATTLMARFGGRWGQGLIDLGLGHRLAFQNGAPVMRRPGSVSREEIAAIAEIDLEGAPLDVRAYPYPTEGLERWIQWINSKAPGGWRGGSLSREAFAYVGEIVRRKCVAEGRLVDVPGPSVYASHFGSWRQAKISCGIAAPYELGRSTLRFATEEVEDFLVAAIKEVGLPLLEGEYRTWARAREVKTHERVASSSTIRVRLGGPSHRWTTARERVLEKHPELRKHRRSARPTLIGRPQSAGPEHGGARAAEQRKGAAARRRARKATS
jgi:hypothetical protein